MVKRAASQPAESKAKKEAKVAPVPVDPFLEELAPILALVNEAGDDLNGSSKEMLQAMAPFCLRASKEERHSYQHQMVEVLENTLKGIEAEQEASVAAVEQRLAEAETEKENSAQTLAAAEEKAEQHRHEKESKDATQLELEAGVDAASKVLCAEQAREKSLAGEQSQIVEEKTSSQQFMAAKWEPLKSGSFAGKEWRERNKTIDATLQVLDRMGLDPSLKAALPTALKTKPSERGRFALKAVEFSEVVMNRFLKELDDKIANFDQEATSRAQATASAQEALTAAEAQLEEGKVAATAAQESLDSALQARSDAEAASKAAPRKVEELTTSLEEQRTLMASAKAVIGTFISLKEKSTPAASVEEVRAQEEVATAVGEAAAPMEQAAEVAA